ncbi:BMP family ABC transporter substrate-binding protein [Streptomyces albofaciens JCM 4342]|uniref:BMP family lipoprotein n=1 Tax=Streptomyces albofaciens TaxID=66866 RepID=UPI00123AA884|nr:BMP family ABC transporter substrate-binding protein [Streptomyces albofaciens]KAA6214362.1 BMP family ABC transporter substrate-binding protein [Streptomyces albofaciens JCM 4342]
MRRVTRFVAAASASALLALTATACGQSFAEANRASHAGVGLAFDIGGRDDHSFNEAAARGTENARKKLGVNVKMLTAKNGETEADREQRLTSFAEAGYNPVIGVGFAYSRSIENVAKDFPETTFGVVDAVPQGKNVDAMVFAEHEGSYLAGVAAALKSKNHKVGFIGGVNNALIQKFQAGFEQGVKDTDPNTKVTSQYLYPNNDKGFNDPAAAKAKAGGMLDSGIDVIYSAAGQSGAGAIEAISKRKGAWAIGVDSDQYQQPGLAKYKDCILTSVVKNVDVAVFDLIKSVEDGKPLTGVHAYDMKKKGVTLATSGGFIKDIQPQIDAARQKIVEGKVKVRETP